MDNSKQVEEILVKILGPVPDIETLSRQNFGDWDSLASISILFELEERFGIEFSETQIEKMTSFVAICEVLDESNTSF